MTTLIPLSDELDEAAQVLDEYATAWPHGFPRAVNLLRARAAALRKKKEPKRKFSVIFVGKKQTRGARITNRDALRRIAEEG